MKKLAFYIAGVFGLTGIDLFTKYLAKVHLVNREIMLVNDVLRLQYVTNDGISFGFFSGNRFMILVNPVIAIFIVQMIHFIFLKKYRIAHVANVFMLAGFFGNYIERVMLGAVTDFISINGFAIFNFADVWISIWEIIFIILMCHIAWEDNKKKKKEKI